MFILFRRGFSSEWKREEGACDVGGRFKEEGRRLGEGRIKLSVREGDSNGKEPKNSVVTREQLSHSSVR